MREKQALRDESKERSRKGLMTEADLLPMAQENSKTIKTL